MTTAVLTRLQAARRRLALATADGARGPVLLAMALVAALVFGRWLQRSSPIGDWLFFDLALIWSWQLYFSAACASSGLAVIERLLPASSRGDGQALALAFPVGLVLFTVGMFAGGSLGLFRPTFAALLPAVLLALGARPLTGMVRRFLVAGGSSVSSPNLLSVAIVGAGVVGVSIIYLGVMTPAALNHDSVWNHMVVAQDYAREGRLVRFPGDWIKNLPHLSSVVYTWAFLVPGLREPALRWMMALHTEFVVFLWTLGSVAAMVSWLARRRVRHGWVAFLLFPAIHIYDNNLGGAADHFVALFAAPLFLVTVVVARRFERGACFVWGLLAGGALLTKMQAIYLVAPLLAVLVAAVIRLKVWGARSHEPPRSIAVGACLVLVAVVLVMGPHLALNTVVFRNPFYPLAQQVFTSSRPTVPDAPLYMSVLFAWWGAHPPSAWAERLPAALKLMFEFSFVPHYTFEHDRPRFGSLFTLTLPWLLVLRSARRLWLGAAVGLGALFCWAATYWVDRNLQTFAPILIAVTGAVLATAWTLGAWARAAVVALVALQLVAAGDIYFAGSGRVTDAVALIRSSGGDAKQRLARYRREYLDLGAALPSNAVVMMHNWHLTLGIDRRVLHDGVAFQGLVDYRPLDTPRALYDRFKSLGVTHVVDAHNVDPAPSKQEEIVFQTFAAEHGTGARFFGGLRMFAMPDVPPPPSPLVHALLVGVAGYADGLYPVTSLQTLELLPPSLRRFPKPLEMAADVWTLLPKADAVIVGSAVPVSAEQTQALDRGFRTAASYRAFRLLIQRR